jgi:hypothetical protein
MVRYRRMVRLSTQVSRYRFRHLAHLIKQPQQRKTVFAVRRDVDGLWWIGPYKWDGRRYTDTESRAYVWVRCTAAESAVAWSGLSGVTVVEVDAKRFARR